MNKNLIKKIRDELDREEVRLDYIRGMLDTLIEMGDHSSVAEHSVVNRMVAGSIPAGPANEGDLLDAQARAALATVQELQKSGAITTE